MKTEDINFFKDQGYLIISDKKILNIKRKIFSDFKIIINRILNIYNLKPFKGSNFDSLINYAYKFDSKYSIFSSCYDLLPGVLSINKLANDKLFYTISKKLGIGNPIIGSLPQIRIDRPKDKVRKTELHQDIWYSFLSDNSITFWFSLCKLTKKSGPLKIYPKTHKLGIQRFTDNKKGTYSARLDINKFDNISALLREDQLIVFSQLLLHESGTNISLSPRISAQIRFNDINTLSKPFSSFRSITSNFVINEQKKYLK